MKYFLLFVAMCLFTTDASAQRKPNHKRFDPARFQIEMEQYITTSAGLTPAEAGAFFPIFREMRKKQRALFEQMRRLRVVDLTDNDACRKAVEKQDELDIEIKTIQRDYHERFMRTIPPAKVLKALKAEDDFHRQAFKNAASKSQPRHKR